MPRNEVGASICLTSTGKVVMGPKSTGTPTSVSVSVKCPPGSTFEGIYHTHPGGVAIPSDTDVKSGARVNAKVLCINADRDLRCYRLKKG